MFGSGIAIGLADVVVIDHADEHDCDGFTIVNDSGISSVILHHEGLPCEQASQGILVGQVMGANGQLFAVVGGTA